MSDIDRLYCALSEAHRHGVERGCLSTQVLLAAYQGNGGDQWKAMQAAMYSMGGVHAPIKETVLFLQQCISHIINEGNINNIIYPMFDHKDKIPGFGCDFIKGEPDPMLKGVDYVIEKAYPTMHKALQMITKEIQRFKNIYPNVALYTAAYAILVNKPICIELLLFKLRCNHWQARLIEYEKYETKK